MVIKYNQPQITSWLRHLLDPCNQPQSPSFTRMSLHTTTIILDTNETILSCAANVGQKSRLFKTTTETFDIVAKATKLRDRS